MSEVFDFIRIYFNTLVLLLFWISSYFLLAFDVREYKSTGLNKERNFTLYGGIFYIIFSLSVYVLAKLL